MRSLYLLALFLPFLTRPSPADTLTTFNVSEVLIGDGFYGGSATLSGTVVIDTTTGVFTQADLLAKATSEAPSPSRVLAPETDDLSFSSRQPPAAAANTSRMCRTYRRPGGGINQPRMAGARGCCASAPARKLPVANSQRGAA